MTQLTYALPEDRSVVRQLSLLIPDYFDNFYARFIATREMYARGVVAPNTRLEISGSFFSAEIRAADDMPFEEMRKDQELGRDDFESDHAVEEIIMRGKKPSSIVMKNIDHRNQPQVPFEKNRQLMRARTFAADLLAAGYRGYVHAEQDYCGVCEEYLIGVHITDFDKEVRWKWKDDDKGHREKQFEGISPEEVETRMKALGVRKIDLPPVEPKRF